MSDCAARSSAALIGPDGFLRIDVRLEVKTQDGAHLYVQYVGLLEVNSAVQRALETGGGTDYGDQYFFTNPRLETAARAGIVVDGDCWALIESPPNSDGYSDPPLAH